MNRSLSGPQDRSKIGVVHPVALRFSYSAIPSRFVVEVVEFIVQELAKEVLCSN